MFFGDDDEIGVDPRCTIIVGHGKGKAGVLVGKVDWDFESIKDLNIKVAVNPYLFQIRKIIFRQIMR